VQGAGFSPEAVPSNQAGGRTTIKPTARFILILATQTQNVWHRISDIKLEGAQREAGNRWLKTIV
jgi:hypothetical protein